MALDLRLEAKMTMGLRMTPRLQQAIKLLQYNQIEMVHHVKEAMLENPALEEVPDSAGDVPADGVVKLMDAAAKQADELKEQRNGDESTIDWEKFLAHVADGPRTPSSLGGTIHDDLPPIETNLTYGESLADHLLFQLKMLKCGADERRAGEAIIHNLDHRGYLASPLAEVLIEFDLDESLAQEARELVMELDPPGCGALDLSECLCIQARLHFPEDENFERILSSHLHNLERRNYQAIAKELELDVEDVIEYHRMIQDLEPHPGRGFTGDEARYITPDIYVEKHEDVWMVVLNEDGMPDLRISRYYQKVMRDASKSDKDYLLDKLRGAEFLIKSINKRRKTIRRVMDSILKFQSEFFDAGVSRLRPLVLQEVADDVGVHMSTVSRVTTNKYVHTPHGTFELKYFFSAGVRQQSGGDMASEAIRNKIKLIVAAENPKKPLSDQAIANALKKEGIRIARRTVAKYREQLGILPSSRRKMMF
jgi:RNA polymerase sigma-54 factor